MQEASKIESMFSEIAVNYDRANHVLSFGMLNYWRRLLVREMRLQRLQSIVDLATGSGDVAFFLEKSLGLDVKIIGLDFCRPMLAEAEKKKSKVKWESDIVFGYGDCLDLPLESYSVDAVTISFGLRNLEDRHQGLKEMHRVLRKSGGKLYIMEFSQPHWWFRGLYYFYLKALVPTIAHITTGNRDAYEYLIASISEFPDREELSNQIKAAGFKSVKAKTIAGGAVALHIATA